MIDDWSPRGGSIAGCDKRCVVPPEDHRAGIVIGDMSAGTGLFLFGVLLYRGSTLVLGVAVRVAPWVAHCMFLALAVIGDRIGRF